MSPYRALRRHGVMTDMEVDRGADMKVDLVADMVTVNGLVDGFQMFRWIGN